MKNNFYYFIFVLIAAWTKNSYSCDCPKQDLKTALKSSTSIFLGKVTTINNSKNGQLENYNLVSFEIEKSWKTVIDNRAQIKVGSSMCSYHFEYGKTYLVFSSDNGPIYTSVCGRTSLAASANEDIKALGKPILLK